MRILDPRERRAFALRAELKAALREQMAYMVDGKESKELEGKIRTLHTALKQALSGDATVKCFCCGAGLDMAICPTVYIVTAKYTANDTGGYGPGETFYSQGGGRRLALCEDCDAKAEEYDAAQELVEESPIDSGPGREDNRP